MSQPNELYAYFTIAGDFDPEQITKRVDVQPTKSWEKGDLNPLNQLERKFSRWSLYSRLGRDCSFEEHIDDVLQQLHAQKEGFRSLSREFGGVLEVVGYFYSDYPGFGISRKQVAQIAEFELEIDCDFYYLFSARREDSE